jgi:predicted MFS family arabinose efflux permease
MSELGGVRQSARAVARNRRLLQVQAGYGFFTTYEGGFWVALLLWAFDVGGATFTGVLSVVMLVPAAALAPMGGALGSRIRLDRMLRSGYVVHGIVMFVVAGCAVAGAPTWLVTALATLWAVLVAWTRPTHYACSAQLATDPADAAAANSMSGVLFSAGYFVGPLAAGLLMAVGGLAWAGVGFGLLAILAGGVLWGARVTAPGGDETPTAHVGPRTVLRALAGRPQIAFVLLVIGIEFVAEGCLGLLAIAYTQDHLGLGDGASGLVISAQGIGGMLGAASAVVVVKLRRLTPAVCGSLALCALPLGLLTLADSLTVALVLVVLAGGVMAFFGVAGITLLQRSVHDDLMTGVLSLRESAFVGGFAIGGAIAPWLIATFGPAGAYAALGAALLLAAVVSLRSCGALDRLALFRPRVVELLRGVPFLGVLGVSTLERLAHGASQREVPSGATVIVQGDAGHTFYVIADGALEATVDGVAVNTLSAGDHFGEIALLRDVPRTASVTALERCDLWELPRDLFLTSIAGTLGADLAEQRVTARLDRRPPSDGTT